MNKTLLLIICDFLLLNLLALTRWEKAEPQHTQLETAAPRAAANAPAVNADMVELMRVSLEDEKNSREQLAAQLASTQGSLSERERNLTALQQQKGQLESSLAATQNTAKELEQRVRSASEEAFLSKEQLARLQRELEEKRAEAERQAAELARAERQNAEARQRIENLNRKVGEVERENALIAQNLTEAKQQVEVERTERARVQEQTTQLAQGVGQLAERSGQLTQEIRDNRPINPNQIFTDFLANRVQASLSARRPGLFRPSTKEGGAQTVLVSDGTRVYALLHLSDTPFTLTEVPSDYDQVSGRITHGSFNAPVGELHFLRLDPRVIVVPIDAALATASGIKIYTIAREPFKFPEAVLVRADDGRYGDTPFRIDATNPSYVKLDNRITTRLFGEIAPKRGDLVFSKTGDLIGLMVNSDYCAVLGDFSPSQTLKAGETPEPKTSLVLSDLQSRWSRLPLKYQ